MPVAKKLLFVVTQADWGGVQSYIVRAALEAMSRGFEVLVAAGGQGELEPRCLRSSIPYRRLARMERELAPAQDVRTVCELISVIRGWHPDIVYLHSSKAGVLGSIAARFAHVSRVVYRIGGWSFLDPVSRLRKTIRFWSERLTAGLKDVIITVHPDDERSAREMGFRPRQAITTIANGLNLGAFDALLKGRERSRRILDDLWEKEVGWVSGEDPGNHKIALTIANFYRTKNLMGYLDAIALVRRRITDVRFIIIGDGEEREAFLAKRRALRLEGQVASLGRQEDAWMLLRGADLFVLPSAKEGMPWTILEAMAAGVACVATDVGGNRWMLGDAGTVVAPNDAEALAESIVARLGHPAYSAQLGRRGREIVQSRFTEAAMWDATFAVLSPPSATGDPR